MKSKQLTLAPRNEVLKANSKVAIPHIYVWTNVYSDKRVDVAQMDITIDGQRMTFTGKSICFNRCWEAYRYERAISDMLDKLKAWAKGYYKIKFKIKRMNQKSMADFEQWFRDTYPWATSVDTYRNNL